MFTKFYFLLINREDDTPGSHSMVVAEGCGSISDHWCQQSTTAGGQHGCFSWLASLKGSGKDVYNLNKHEHTQQIVDHLNIHYLICLTL